MTIKVTEKHKDNTKKECLIKIPERISDIHEAKKYALSFFFLNYRGTEFCGFTCELVEDVDKSFDEITNKMIINKCQKIAKEFERDDKFVESFIKARRN